MKSQNVGSFLKEEFIEMTFDLEMKSLYTLKAIVYYCMNLKKKKKTRAKYTELCTTILLIFPSLYMIESEFSYVYYLLSK